MPDQSLSNEPVSGKTDQATGNPADTTANHPEVATAESQASNVTRGSEGQTQQADVTINQDPTVSTGDEQTVGTEGSQATEHADDYDDDEVWPYRKLQAHAKELDVDASGKRDEIVARLREKAASGSGTDTGTTDVPRGAVDPTNVENGGIRKTSVGQTHAEILQGLSNERRAQQLAAVSGRASSTGGDED